MDSLKLDNNGGAWIYQDTLAFMQRVGREAINAVVSLLGDNVIVSGCVQTGSVISDGIVIIGGEVMPFQGGGFLTNVAVVETISKEQFEDGTQKDFYIRRKAQMTLSTGVSWAEFSSIKTLKAFKNLPTQVGSDYAQSSEEVLATIKAVYDLKQELENQVPAGVIMMWSGSISTIPAGFGLCDGLDGRPNLMDRFIVGAGSEYAVGAIGGEKTHTLTVAEIPSHSHSYTAPGNVGEHPGGTSGFARPNGTEPAVTATQGGGQAHENRPPYYALAYIIKL